MKRLRRICTYLFLLLFLFIFLSCSGSGGAGMSSSGASLTSIEVMPTNPSIAKGTTKQFTATGIYSDNSTKDITSLITWRSSDNGIATISNSGLASSVSTGATTIKATYEAILGTTTLTVTAAELSSISVTPNNPQVAAGTSQQFVATGTYTDNTTQNVTTEVTWSSSLEAIAVISNMTGSNGVATAQIMGSTTITANDPTTNISASSTLIVVSASAGHWTGSWVDTNDSSVYGTFSFDVDSTSSILNGVMTFNGMIQGVNMTSAQGVINGTCCGSPFDVYIKYWYWPPPSSGGSYNEYFWDIYGPVVGSPSSHITGTVNTYRSWLSGGSTPPVDKVIFIDINKN